MMGRMILATVVGVVIFSGCGTCSLSPGRPFSLSRDAFAFTNELTWKYEWGPDGKVTTTKADTPPSHPQRCFPMTRSVREFFYHARFEPEGAKLEREEYRTRVKEVVGRSSRCPSPTDDRVVIPGYADLHAFSMEYADVLRDECGGRAMSFLQRGNWRMIFPVTHRRFRKTAITLRKELDEGRVPIVHVYRFPNTKLNHAILLYDVEEASGELRFLAYDPNTPSRPVKLNFDLERDTFVYERNHYFGGGDVRVYEVYRGLCY